MSSFATTSTGKTAVGDAPKQLPVIMVPGIMGSRLTRFEGKEPVCAWDPHPYTLGGMVRNATHFSGILLEYDCCPDEGWTARRSDLDDGYAQDAHRIGHWVEYPHHEIDPHQSKGTLFSIISGYYSLVFAMAGIVLGDESDVVTNYASNLTALGYAPKVFCAGYDFRKDNRRSKQTLEAIVDVALRECRAEKVILVAHSMGGLVARYFARKHPEKVQAVFLVGSPSLGAPEAFHYLKDFHDPKLIGGLNASIDRIFWDLNHPIQGIVDVALAKSRAQRFTRYNMPSIYQLAASDLYALATGDDDWLRFSDEVAFANQNPHIPSSHTVRAPTDCTDVDLLYANMHTGFIDYGDGQMQVQRDFLDSALEFHRTDLSDGVSTTPPDRTQTKAWMHPRTYVAYSAHHETIVAIELDDEGNLKQVRGPGDASVPEASANVEDAVVGPSHGGRSPILHRHPIPTAALKHGDLCADATVIQWVLQGIVTECTAMIECEE